MNKVKLKQGTLAWEKARETRIGGSEIFDIVRYYATDEELGNCGINAESFRAEKPYTTAWALYHKMRADGIYKRAALDPEYAEYGHAVESYGMYILGQNRRRKLRPGEVYADDRTIASLDISGVAEEVDIVAYEVGFGTPKEGQRFVCEQKSVHKHKLKDGIPFKYIVQAQYQIMNVKADFFILQLMVLNEDTPFIRGRICQMSRRTKFKYLDENMMVTHCYFKYNEHLAGLISVCLERFFCDVDNKNEPRPFIGCDSQKNIIESIRLNTAYNPDADCEYDLSAYAEARRLEDSAKKTKKEQTQKIIEMAMEKNVCRFRSPDGMTAYFSSDGKLLTKEAAK